MLPHVMLQWTKMTWEPCGGSKPKWVEEWRGEDRNGESTIRPIFACALVQVVGNRSKVMLTTIKQKRLIQVVYTECMICIVGGKSGAELWKYLRVYQK